MNSLTSLTYIGPINKDAVSQARDSDAAAALERERDGLLYVVNYLEALRARLLVLEHGRLSLEAIDKMDSSSWS